MNIRKNDTVRVISGKDRGKTGKVLAVLPREERLMIEGINLIKKHVRANPNMRQAGIVQQPGAMALANVMLVCTKCGKPTRVGNQVLQVQEGDTTKNQKIRVCKQCKQQID